ncbi:hypothetical protein H6P81_020183 [Aristolochia fimbriata]|uniref:Uncharacterized protein n=1 Tax=Aristolochia fimbriata TaxID=158543 RepID=A0AAV7DTU9_ARIFI|nr:hypothetical protein H6P81_020183 [Aristolochia fimbriata]
MAFSVSEGRALAPWRSVETARCKGGTFGRTLEKRDEGDGKRKMVGVGKSGGVAACRRTPLDVTVISHTQRPDRQTFSVSQHRFHRRHRTMKFVLFSHSSLQSRCLEISSWKLETGLEFHRSKRSFRSISDYMVHCRAWKLETGLEFRGSEGSFRSN